MLAALLAVLGLFTAAPPTSVRASCPMQASMMMHHQHRPTAPTSRELPCAACIGVLLSLPLIRPYVLPAVAQFTDRARSLSGIDWALDPPPPRAA
jgi:hypothetical protein